MFRAAVFLVTLLAIAKSAQAQSSFGTELASLDFENILGSPLAAVVHAQTLAAQTTATFINDVGFTGSDTKEVVMVTFNYETVEPNSTTPISKSMSVPFLMIIPIPFLQVDIITIDLIVKLDSARTVSASTDTTSSASFSSASKSFWGTSKSSFKSSVVTQQKTASSATVTKSYSLNIHVQGSQAPVPAGMARVFDLFDTIIRSGAPKV